MGHWIGRFQSAGAARFDNTLRSNMTGLCEGPCGPYIGLYPVVMGCESNVSWEYEDGGYYRLERRESYPEVTVRGGPGDALRYRAEDQAGDWWRPFVGTIDGYAVEITDPRGFFEYLEMNPDDVDAETFWNVLADRFLDDYPEDVMECWLEDEMADVVWKEFRDETSEKIREAGGWYEEQRFDSRDWEELAVLAVEHDARFRIWLRDWLNTTRAPRVVMYEVPQEMWEFFMDVWKGSNIWLWPAVGTPARADVPTPNRGVQMTRCTGGLGATVTGYEGPNLASWIASDYMVDHNSDLLKFTDCKVDMAGILRRTVGWWRSVWDRWKEEELEEDMENRIAFLREMGVVDLLRPGNDFKVWEVVDPYIRITEQTHVRPRWDDEDADWEAVENTTYGQEIRAGWKLAKWEEGIAALDVRGVASQHWFCSEEDLFWLGAGRSNVLMRYGGDRYGVGSYVAQVADITGAWTPYLEGRGPEGERRVVAVPIRQGGGIEDIDWPEEWKEPEDE